jgi:two-component system chemotaxis response regulator CheB
VGASAGGVEALCELARALPPGLPAAVFVVCHFPAGASSALPDILSRQGKLLARHARDGEPIYPAHVYVAPPDFHLLLEGKTVRLSRGPREHRFRPAIDILFRSAARAYGPRVVGVLLSGALDDGVAGLLAVRAAGGVAVIQDPADAIFPTLPRSAREIAGADHVAAAAALGPLLTRLVQQAPVGGDALMTDPVERIMQTAAHDLDQQARDGRPGNVSIFTCPECGGCMWQVDDKKLVQFRCHVGHGYAAETLLAEQSEALEAALWTAVRTFREKSVLARQLARRARETGNATSAARFEDDAHVAERYGALIHEYLLRGEAPPSTAAGKEEGTASTKPES